MKFLNPQHRASDAFDKTMSLLNDIIEVRALPDLDSRVVLLIVAFDTRFIGAALVNINYAWLAIASNRFSKRTQSGFLIRH